MDVHACVIYYDDISISKQELLTRALYVFLRGDDDFHQSNFISTCIEGIDCDGSGGVDNNILIGTVTTAGGAAEERLSHYRQKQLVTIT